MSSSPGLRAEPLPDDAPHVLIVDDDFKIRDLLARYLYSQGFRVTTAADAEMAKASLRGLDFDIVLRHAFLAMQIGGCGLGRSLDTRRPARADWAGPVERNGMTWPATRFFSAASI